MQRPRQITLVTLLCASLLGCGSLKRFVYEGFNRDERQHPKRVVQVLAIEPGMQVADIGAGGGYFTFRLADAVGETGRVYAVDVDDDMISYLEERAREDGYKNVTVVRGEFADPLLPDGQIDLIFSSNTYHHIEGRVAYFRGVLQDLAQGGRVAIEVRVEPEDHFPHRRLPGIAGRIVDSLDKLRHGNVLRPHAAQRIEPAHENVVHAPERS